MNKVLSSLVLIATFFSPNLGLSGLCAIVFTNVVGHVIGINRKLIEEGLYGFNSLLLGLFLAYQYEINSTFILLFVVSVALLLIISVWLFGIFSRHSLPFLSFPFIITYCIISMSAGSFTNVLLNEDLVYVGNHIARQQGTYVYQLAHSLDDLALPNAVLIYLKTLAGTFFQTSLLAGILIVSGLLYFSRIAFSLSLLGFFSAYFFYSAFGADVNELNLNLVGSNFIFMAIGIGCFYIVPNSYSYLAVFCLTPILIMLMIFLNKVMFVFQLKSFTLSFSVIISLFLLFLQHRWFHQFLHLVTIQYYSAEKTIYKYITSINRFKNEHLAKIQLPFWGDWYVSQGYNGKITHLGDWGKALDFVIIDESKETYQNNGHKREDYYCYNKPVLAPLDGYIYSILNTVEENEIAGVNTVDNWGNTLVMNHLNGTFSQISHIKKDSFKVSIGEYVTKGTVLATCGNSGRSPEPHIHFQIQYDPKIGAKTIEYPVSYFIEKDNSKQILRVSEVPKQDTVISNVDVNSLLTESFSFLPGKKLRFIESNTAEVVDWEVFTDQWNRKYIYCQQTKSVAYFVNDGTMFYFFDFEGSRNSLLFQFYLASYRVLLGCHEGVVVNDLIPLIHFNNKVVQIIQDFVAPFYLFTKAAYQSSYIQVDNVHDPSVATLKSSVEAKFIKLSFRKIEFEIKLSNKNIHQFSYTQNGMLKTYVCIQ
jgi:urea transporter/murein DD-endopeptidase MepM/ murein hydrolase activator NlpD